MARVQLCRDAGSSDVGAVLYCDAGRDDVAADWSGAMADCGGGGARVGGAGQGAGPLSPRDSVRLDGPVEMEGAAGLEAARDVFRDRGALVCARLCEERRGLRPHVLLG